MCISDSSWGMAGAPYFSAMGALRCGSGLVFMAIPSSIYPILAPELLEAVFFPLHAKEGRFLSLESLDDLVLQASGCDAVVIGTGLSLCPETQQCVRQIVPQISCPVVIDADGLNAYKNHRHLLKKLKNNVVLTPHYGELSRLLGIGIDQLKKNKTAVAQNFVQSHSCVLVMKDFETCVVQKSQGLFQNSSGNPGMATGGMGDILAGMIASFLGQGLSEWEASCLAVFLHGRAGDEAAKKKGELSLLPRDLLDSFDHNFWSKVHLSF